MMTVALAAAMLAALAGSAFCSGAETAFLSVSRERILHLSRAGGRKAKIVQKALADMGWTTTTILIGNNLANVVYSAASAALSLRLCPDSAAKTVWSFAAAFTVLYVSEFLPKILCSARPLRRSLAIAPAYRWMASALWPLAALAMKVTGLFIVARKDAKYRLTTSDLLRILQDRKDGVCLSDFESAIITRLVVLRAKRQPITPEAILSALRQAPD